MHMARWCKCSILLGILLCIYTLFKYYVQIYIQVLLSLLIFEKYSLCEYVSQRWFVCMDINLLNFLNNNPNVLQFKYALQRILQQNSIEPSKTGNCTPFEDSLTQIGGLVYSSSKSQMADPVIETSDQNAILAELMFLLNDINNPHPLKDNILYYIAGYIVWSLLAKVSCETCKGELLLDPTDAHASQLSVGPLCAKFTSFKQRGGLVFSSTAVFNVVRLTESVFYRHVLGAGISVPNEKNTDLKIQNIIFEQMGTKVFSTNPAHSFDHKLEEERDHTSSLLKLVISKSLHLRLTTCSKKFNELMSMQTNHLWDTHSQRLYFSKISKDKRTCMYICT